MMMPDIDSPDVRRYRDRRDAGAQLAWALRGFRGRRPLVLGIPRGGVVLADQVARDLGGDFDVALIRKLRAPDRSALAIGSVAENGLVFLNDGWEDRTPNSYLKREAADALSHLRELRRLYTPGGGPTSPLGRLVIIVDDGIATGATMTAALRSVSGAGASFVVAATPIAPTDTLGRLRREAGEVVALATPEPFYAVSPFYVDFKEVTDHEVVDLLRKAPRPANPGRVG